MVMPMSSNRNSSMFPEWEYNFTSYAEECWDEFHVIPKPTWITTQFGGHNHRSVLQTFGSNIIFSNGLLDPWSGGGVLENISDSIVALVTEKGAHHLDLRGATADDPDWLVEQRASKIKIIDGWIGDYYKKMKAVFSIAASFTYDGYAFQPSITRFSRSASKRSLVEDDVGGLAS
nr:lysosomal Pro-X carboxypeptidase [Tanacetum cinerariifolium]